MALSCWSVRLGLTLCVVYVFVFRDDSPRRVRQVGLAVTSVTSLLQQQQQRRGTLVLQRTPRRPSRSRAQRHGVRAASGPGHCLLEFEMPPVKLCKDGTVSDANTELYIGTRFRIQSLEHQVYSNAA